MPTITSPDGTAIAYERAGSGPPLVLVDGAMCYRAAGPMRPLAAALHGTFTVYTYDRRGRGATAATGAGITRLALYEPPFLTEVEDGGRKKEYTDRLHELLDAGRNGDAVALFMTTVGIPAPAIAEMRTQPGWAVLEAIAPTLAYDDEVLGDGRVPRDLASTIAVPTLVVAGGASPQSLQRAAQAAAQALPTAKYGTLDGQTHDVAPAALAPVLVEFFTA